MAVATAPWEAVALKVGAAYKLLVLIYGDEKRGGIHSGCGNANKDSGISCGRCGVDLDGRLAWMRKTSRTCLIVMGKARHRKPS